MSEEYKRGFEDAKIQAARVISDNYQKCITISQCLIMALEPTEPNKILINLREVSKNLDKTLLESK